MAQIVAILGGAELPALHTPFIQQPIENASDQVTLDGTLYTDFVSQRRAWQLHWEILSEDEYNLLKSLYDQQFADEAYHDLTIDYYGLADVPVRMTINERDIRNDGACMLNVNVTLTEKNAIAVGS